MLNQLEQKRRDAGSLNEGDIGAAEIAFFLYRNLKLIGLFVGAGILLAVLNVVTTRPIFTARAQVLIDVQTPQSLPQRPGEGMIAIDTAQVESQLAILRSDNLSRAVVAQLSLADDPEFVPVRGSLLGGLGRLFGAKPAPARSAEEATALAILSLQDRLEVRRQGVSLAIDVYVRSFDREKSARLANALADAYVTDQLSTRQRTARQGSEWLEDRIESLRRQMNAAALKVQEFKARRDYRIVAKAERNEDAAARAAEAASGQSQTLEELESTASTYRRMYESFLQSHADGLQRESYPISNARVITPAMAPFQKSHPKTMLVLALGALLGSLLGIGVALVRQSMDRSVRSRQEIRDSIGLDCIAQVPRATSARAVGWRRFDPIGEEVQRDLWHEVRDAPYSRFSEGIGHLKLKLTMGKRTKAARTIGITSALAGEGKSTVACNLASLFALHGAKAVLVDTDVKNSVATRALTPHARVGLLDVLGGHADVADCLLPVKGSSLMVLPIGDVSLYGNTPELFGSDRMSKLVQDLGRQFDVVIFDLPPVELVKDGIALSPLLEGMLVVAEWGKTPLPVLADTVDALREANAALLGVVLTKVSHQFGGRMQRQARPYLVEPRNDVRLTPSAAA